jgi:hypothetical protein
VLQIAGYVTARVVVPIISLGFASVEPAPKGVRVYPKWHGFHRASGGRIVIDAEMGALLGLIFWVLIAAVAYLWYNYGAA